VESNRPLRRRFVDEGADPTEDIARTMTVLDDPSERLPHLLEIRRSTTQPTQRRLGVGDRRGERLVHCGRSNSVMFVRVDRPRTELGDPLGYRSGEQPVLS
jgi:hypothetical protein